MSEITFEREGFYLKSDAITVIAHFAVLDVLQAEADVCLVSPDVKELGNGGIHWRFLLYGYNVSPFSRLAPHVAIARIIERGAHMVLLQPGERVRLRFIDGIKVWPVHIDKNDEWTPIANALPDEGEMVTVFDAFYEDWPKASFHRYKNVIPAGGTEPISGISWKTMGGKTDVYVTHWSRGNPQFAPDKAEIESAFNNP